MKNKILKAIDFISYHENKIIFALWVIVIFTICGIMGLTIVNDHAEIFAYLIRHA